ncbi:MAG TPA: hypothetical protein PK467_05885 [Candidatus Wallbacteria bacterium]|nr:hypothetical protein [Candidatus Wallbacteria bacterium]
MRSKRPAANKGLTFTQVLIAIVLLSVTVIPVASVFFVSNRNVEKGGALLDATIILQSIIDTVKDDKFIFDNKGKSISFPDPKYPALEIEKNFLERYKASGVIKIEQAEGHNDAGLAELSVTLYWNENGVKRETSINTYVANINDVKFLKVE